MESKELCKNFLDADKIINDGYYDTMTMEDKIKYPNFNKHCPNSNCETYMKLDSLSEDLFDQLGTQIEDEYYEYVMMWLSDKLFKIANEDNNPQINDITLNSAYEKYLNKNIENWNYWNLLDIKEGLKEVNLMYMKHFYKLLNNICNAIVYYNSNEDDIKKFISNSTDCSDQYSSLYDSVPKCNSYLHLLDNLKKTYEDFKNSVHDEIKNKHQHLAKDLQTLTIGNTSSYFVEKLKEFDFNSSDCKPKNTKTRGLSHKNGSDVSDDSQKGSQNPLRSSEGGSGSQGDSSKQGGSVDGSKASGDPTPPHSSGASNGYFPSIWGMNFNITSYMPNVPGIYQSSRNILTSATNKISDTYTNTVDIVKGAYDSTVNNIKDAYDRTMTSITNAYDRTTNYIGNAVNSVTSQFNPFITSQLGDNQPGSNSSGGETDTSNPSQPNPKQSVNPPSPPQSTPQQTPQLSQIPSSPQSQDPPQTPSSSQPQDSQQIPSPSQPLSGPTQDSSQITDQNGGSNPVQSHDTNPGTGISQTTNYSTDSSSTVSRITTGIVVKMNEKSSIWFIAQNKKYEILGIGIICISIFAFLAIMYKYISFGSAKNSKKKKSMKRVIKYGDGNRKTQIIIKSYDRNKDLKPIINSVDRKKDPLLNIYKLMQADPIPFINLFFLLIFFVYKRKCDFLEL
ncbi:CIR protein PIR protein [Plasmodium vinckei]|uniref:CIR protein PIR protein n=1 Tax=Plasmodium vinckei TaxID=5860 RepID=A0A6V7SR06_PLAVN|nr:CIR protein PIR protein [Plasmodium vinckei]